MPTGSGVSAQWGMAAEVYTNEVQQISGTPSATFGLTFDGANTTVSLATNAASAAVQSALEALPNIGVGGVVCSGGALPAAIICTFSGALVAKRNVPILSVQGAVTGLTFATNTPGTGYGDPQTVTRFLEFTEESIQLKIDRIESKALRAGNRAVRTDRWGGGQRQANGDFTFELASKGFGLPLGQCFGIDGIVTTPSGATNTRDQTFNVTTNDNFNRSFTAQLGTPDVDLTVQPFTYKGCKVTDWEISMQNGGLGLLKMSVDAQDEATNIALASASYASAFELLYFSGGQMTIGGANVDVRKITITGKMSYAVDRFFLRAATTAGGPTLKKEPIANDYMEITGEMELEFSGLSIYNRFVNGTLAAVTAAFQGSIIEAGGGATINPRFGLTLTIPNARFDGNTPDIKGMDIVPIIVPFKALYDGSSNVMTAVYRSTDTAM
jgi:hypothetical protein